MTQSMATLYRLYGRGAVMVRQSFPGSCRVMSMDPRVQRVPGHVALPTGRKVTIVGAGSVGVAIGISLLAKNIADPLVLIDIDGNRALGEVQDMQHASAFLDTQEIVGGNDYRLTEGSRVCIVTAGARQKPGQSRTELLEDNIKIMKHIITELMKYSPDTIIIVVSNPVDVLTYAAWKISGLPLNRVFGSGTHLDSSRFQYFIGKLTGYPVHLVKAQILGEHGASCAPVWSGVNVAGLPIERFGDLFTDEKKKDVFEQVLQSVPELLRLKGYTSTAVGFTVADQVESILFNKTKALPCSTLVKGFYGIEEDVFLSLPCMLGNNGVSAVLPPDLNEQEKNLFKASADNMFKYQQEIDDIICK
ncbi:L-lactate dehydrogenase C chain [Halyomorpha halys]|uniref:L-lactate dehydrogenase C chain n=1 Tax=Halyomorpha halys TaxID=286706 RepID=UPI0006D51C90|nr:L-lactate dehydrogenase C chain-like [Halyomorpha halys]